jgi:chemotaxis methyl-accepting protein methylase
VLCRNLLIYIEREAQEKIVENFSRVLRPGGFLTLGRTEVLVGSARESFEVVDARERIDRKAGCHAAGEESAALTVWEG